MPSRLVLGCGSEHRVLVERLAASGDVLAVVDDEDASRWLAERGVPVERVDPEDVDALRRVGGTPDSVLVVPEDGTRTERLVAVAREAFPDATVLARDGPTGADHPADRYLDPSEAIAERVLGHVGSPVGDRALRLRATLRSLPEPVAVLMHDNPDPDAIASAVALTHLAASMGVDAEPCYFGDIAHQENRALVNLLELDLRRLTDPAAIEEYESIALVDHARPGVNDSLATDVPVDVVIDHHPTHGPDQATFVDLRSGVGSTSTLLVEYFERLGVPFTETVATALLYGLRVDTDDFTREAVRADFEAAATLVERADHSVLERVESPTISTETLGVLARAIDRRQHHDGVLTACVGELSDRDSLAQAADRLLDLEGVTTTVVFGIIEDTVYLSARARGTTIDLGETLRTAYDRLGSAGGHAEMAGAQIPMGMLVEPADEDPVAIVEAVLTEAFLDAVQTAYAPASSEYDVTDADPLFRARRERAGGDGARVASQPDAQSTPERSADRREQGEDDSDAP